MEEAGLAGVVDALRVLNRYFEHYFALIGEEAGGAPFQLTKSRLRETAKDHFEISLLRKEILGPELSSEYCWLILMALYTSESDAERMCVTDIVYATGIPVATVIRWLSMLTSRGVVSRVPDTKDARRTWIALEEVGVSLIEDYFAIEASRTLPKKVFRHRASQG